MVLFCSFYHLLSNLVIFSPFCPLKFYSIHSVLFNLLRSIKSTLALFSPHWSYSVHFGPIWSILSTLVLFSPIWSILFALVLFSPHWFLQPIMSTSVLFGPIWSHSAHFGVHSFLFSPLYSYSVHFGHIWSIQSTLFLFGPIQSTLLHLIQFAPFGPHLVHSVH